MIVGEPTELGLPRGAEDLQIISHNRLLPRFNTYAEDLDGDDHKLKRTVSRWNPRVYAQH